MPNIDLGDISKLAFPTKTREQFTALAWESQRMYFLLLIIIGSLLFLWGYFA